MRTTFLAGMAAAGLSAALVLGHATNTTAATSPVELANTVIGAGGEGDPTGARVPAKLANTVVPTGYDYDPVNYPATIALAASRDIGVPVLRGLVRDHSGEPFVVVAGYSEGALVGEKVRGILGGLGPTAAPLRSQLAFLFIASPFAPNGGIYNRLPGLAIPGIIDAFRPATPTRYDTTYVAMEYDPYADFPAFFNPLALVNTALAVRYAHPDKYYDAVRPGVTPAYVTQVPAHVTDGGTDTYVLVYNQHLPLFAPLRELAATTFTSPLVEPILGAIEPLFRVVIDMSYTDRTNANVGRLQPFSIVTPPAKIIEALGAVPGALLQGVANLLSGGKAANVPPPAPNLTTVPVLDAPAPAALARQTQSSVTPSRSSAPVVEVTPTSAPRKAAEGGLHPAITSNGNKFTPGETAVAHSPETTTTTATTITPDPTPANPTPANPTPDATPGSPETDTAAA